MQQMEERLSLNFLCLPKHRSFKRNATVINLLPSSFINQTHLVTGEETRSLHHSQTNCHKLSYLPSIILRAHFSLLKTIHFPQEVYISPSFPYSTWQFTLHSKLPGELLIFPYLHVCVSFTCEQTWFVFHLLICLLLQASQLRTQKGKGKIVFSSPTRVKRDNIITFQVIEDTFKSVLRWHLGGSVS